MNPVLIPTLAPPSRTPGSAAHASHAADGGFRDMLDGSSAGRERRDSADLGLHAAVRSLADRLADHPARDQPSAQVQDAEPAIAEDAKRVERDPDAEGEDDADRGEDAFLWFDARTTAPATADKSRIPKGSTLVTTDAGDQADEGADADLHLREARVSANTTPKAKLATESDLPSGHLASSASTSGTDTSDAGRNVPQAAPDERATTLIDGQPVQPETRRRGATEIAAVLDGKRTAPHPAETPAKVNGAPAADAPQSADFHPDIIDEVRLLSEPQLKGNSGGLAIQQMPFGSAVAMLNLMARETPANGTQSNAGPISRSRGAREAGSEAEASHSSASLPEAASAEPSEASIRRVSPASVDTPSVKSHADRDAREGSRGSDQDPSQPTFAERSLAKAADAPIAARLGATAAGVVETFASAPALRAAPAASHLVAESKTVSSTTHSLTIQLRPVELGEITATLRMNGDTITVEMATEKMEAYDRLNVDSDAIVKALRGLGLQVDQVTVQPPQVAAASSRSDGGMQNQTSNGSNQQFAQTGNSSGGGSEGQRGTASQGEQRSGGQARQPASPVNENRVARGLVI